MENNEKIKLSNITKTYKMYDSPMDQLKESLSLKGKVRHSNFNALTNVSFSVNKGEILGIMGRNGAGKSTLLKIITGVLSPTSGQIEVEGKISSLLELGAGFNPEYNGIENIYFYGMLMKLTKKQIDERLTEILEFAEIGDYVYQPVKTYSSGMFARLAFSCAINVEPDILIVDEILSVGDIRFQSKCFKKFKEFKEQGVTILYVGHDVSLMKTFCDKGIWLNDGKVIMMGDPSEVAAKYVEFMYLDDSTEFTTFKRLNDDNKETTVVNDIKISNVKNSIFPEAIAHWGTNPGMFQKVSITNEYGKEINYFAPQDKVCISLTFKTGDIIDYKNFSVAFSIKNLEGTDIIVKTTYDEGLEIIPSDDNRLMIRFELITRLAVGEYYLAIALENRRETTTMYYEYVEGARYFKVFADKKIYGKVDIPAHISIVRGE
ncbi:lipopolysaccharide transport system ATP-binding protein [Anaerosporobacter mobilis DSM 15930]|jgi:lipopolysaccharide transport system ATP-binding protein|uniref:Lipopolysaccharide transport system ATP-binding protein n=1 Tax=Anaerosporobacter mobilis DSM 15930 TaxID=1120996 RepID=A0A1M7LDG6_9FIRM|nr:ABC transporter ATP-binding protein [Anaerosporobacter mobilis]SHM75945.1 lipopolysaccharide transport system ATP-binding protein [Anaerosporobacter mobilis DSM 15930]